MGTGNGIGWPAPSSMKVSGALLSKASPHTRAYNQQGAQQSHSLSSAPSNGCHAPPKQPCKKSAAISPRRTTPASHQQYVQPQTSQRLPEQDTHHHFERYAKYSVRSYPLATYILQAL